MRHLALYLAAAAIALPALTADNLKPEDIPKNFTDKRPFDLEAGPDAATLKGKGVLFNIGSEIEAPTATPSPEPTPSAASVPWTPFVSYDVNASYNYTDRTKRIGEVSLKPSIVKGWFSVGDPFGGDIVTRRSVMPYLDLRSRNTNAPVTTTNDKQKAFFYGGAGVQFRQEFRTLLEWESITGADLEQPTLGVTYYKKVSGELPKDAPEGFDAVQALLTFDVPIPLTANLSRATEFRTKFAEYLKKANIAAATGQPLPEAPKRPSFPFTFSVELKATRPTAGATRKVEHYADIALKMIQPNAKVGYALRYRTGKDLGFEHDNKILAGILLRLFDGK